MNSEVQIPDRSPSSSEHEQNLPKTETLPSLKDLNLEPYERRNNTPYTHRRRHSLGYPLGLEDHVIDDEDDEYEPAPDSPILWRRTSLDQGMSRLRNTPKLKEDTEMEYIPERRMRKRSISEDPDVGDDSDTEEEEKPKKPKLRKAYRGRRGKGKIFQCSGKDSCPLCKNGAPHYLQKSMNPGWRETLLAVFENFDKRVTYREWMSNRKRCDMSMFTEDMKNKEHVADIEWLYLPDSYGFLEYHWDILCPPQHKNRSFTGNNWRKTLQDTLSHNRTYFISGKELFGKTGFWRLAETVSIGNQSDRNCMDNFRHSSAPPSMFTIDTLLKRAEVQGHIPSFGASVGPQQDSSPEISSPQTEMSELELLVSAIEKMHSACT
jgi:hypothetical protein